MNIRMIAAVLLLSAAGGCERSDWGPDQLGQGHTSRTLRTAQLGREVYATYCVGCHGEQGDGNGPAARFLEPKPRDFRLGRIKFAGVSSGDAPRDEDYQRILKHGLDGTAMPSFALLSDQERAAVVAYLRGFTAADKRDTPGAALSVGQDPWARDPAGGIAEGKKVYHGFAKCWSCHPAYEAAAEITRFTLDSKLPAPELRADAYQPLMTESQWGAPIRPPDFLVDRVKTGLAAESLAQVINAGVGGTAMPTWTGALSPAQVWGLAYYVRSLAQKRGTAEGRKLRDQLNAIKQEVTK
jgi:cytochrome c oxidase cbb3-type subunit 2